MNWTQVLEGFYILIGLAFCLSGYYVLQDKANSKRLQGAAFWVILGLCFSLASCLPDSAIGLSLVILAILSGFKQVQVPKFQQVTQDFKKRARQQVGGRVFIPPIALAGLAFVFSQILPKLLPKDQATLSGQLSIGFAALSGMALIMVITRAKGQEMASETARIIQQMGPSIVLPQILATLGAVFSAAGLGVLIASSFVQILPADNRFLGVVMYGLGMAVFTMIMGNGFAAFSVITAGIGVPFVIAQGANPAIAGALAMTCGYTGTLMTPMAANFNIVPANLLETRSTYGIIKYQVPTALSLLAIQIVLMYLWAF